MDSPNHNDCTTGRDDADLCHVTLFNMDDIELLKFQWTKLATESNAPFFLSWHWISTWLDVIRPQVQVLRVEIGSELIAIALVAFGREKVAKLFKSRAFYFHQTGDALDDQIWPEYNSILSAPKYNEHAIRATTKFFKSMSFNLDELRLGATLAKDVELFSAHFDSRHDYWTSPAFGVDLEALNQAGGKYLDRLSRNTRHQINRSIKRYKESGRELSLEFANTKSDALDLFSNMAPFHKLRWGSELGQSGFANPKFVSFHRALIENNWDKGVLELVELRAGEEPVGYFYNFLFRNRVYFYMSGLKQERNSKLKPGLSGHALLIEHYRQAGFAFYDFMGGNERYKKSLGTQHSILFQSSFRWSRFHFSVESMLRKVKRLIYSKS